MAAPKGNQFWKLRSKHGRDKLFKSPELLWEAACEYFQWCIDNPLQGTEAIKGGQDAGKLYEVPYLRAFTWEGLCRYLNCNKHYFNDFEANLKGKDKEDFSEVITRIRGTLYQQKFEGAAANMLNANIIARDLGLAEKKEVTGKDGKDLIPQVYKLPDGTTIDFNADT